jgi:hypothetical protein
MNKFAVVTILHSDSTPVSKPSGNRGPSVPNFHMLVEDVLIFLGRPVFLYQTWPKIVAVTIATLAGIPSFHLVSDFDPVGRAVRRQFCVNELLY